MPGMTIAEKILSEHSGKEARAGDIVFCDVDFMVVPDSTGIFTVRSFKEMEGKKVCDPNKIMFVFDHCSPPPNQHIANMQKYERDFVLSQGVILAEGGEGVCHQLAVEKGYASAGKLVVGADSHTCTYGAVGAFATGVGATDMAATMISGKNWFKVPETIRVNLKNDLPAGCTAKDIILTVIGKIGAEGGNYKAFEFYGDYFEKCTLDDRMTIANMVVEMGGKTGFTCFSGLGIQADEDAVYCETVEIDLAEVVPCVAKPHTVDNWAPVSEVAGKPINYAFIGSCTNGRFEDLKAAADILRGGKLARGVRLLVVPASKDILLRAADEGVLKDLVDAGAAVFTPSCAACVGTHGGVPADGETVLSTTNRNFKGRMGNPNADIYLVSPMTLAASCLTGVITDPRPYVKE